MVDYSSSTPLNILKKISGFDSHYTIKDKFIMGMSLLMMGVGSRIFGFYVMKYLNIGLYDNISTGLTLTLGLIMIIYALTVFVFLSILLSSILRLSEWLYSVVKFKISKA